MQITAAVVNEAGAAFTLENVTLDSLRPDEIRVRIAGVGVCHTDIVAQMGAFNYERPVVLGHEGAGIIEEIGSDIVGFAPGDRVAISFRSCGQCRQCAAGLPSYCQTMPALNYGGMRPDGSTTLSKDGGPIASNFFGQSSFATHAITYARNLVKVPDDLPLELAGPLGCGIQTGAGAVMRALACEAGSSLLVTGGGAVGLSAVMGGAIQECATIIVIEPHAERRQLALELGATHVIDPGSVTDWAAAVRAILPDGVHYAVDTTGRPDALASALAVLAPRGALGLVGVAPPGAPVPAEINALLTLGHRIIGIIEGDSDPATFIPELFEHYRGGRLPFDRFVTIYPMSKINEAIADQHAGRCIKVVLTPDAPAAATTEQGE